MGSAPASAQAVLEAAADLFGHGVDELLGRKRWEPLTSHRSVTMAAVRELTDFSYPAIGRLFGDRDHTTVMTAVQHVAADERLQGYLREVVALAAGVDEPKLRDEVEALRREVAELRAELERVATVALHALERAVW